MLHVILDVRNQMDTHMQARTWVEMHGSTCIFWGAECAPILFSNLGFVWLYICIYIYNLISITIS